MFQRILVLLDGSQRAELALPVVVRLARATGASLTFLRMVTLPPDYVWYKLEPPFLARSVLATAKLDASTYLKGLAWEMELAGISVQTCIMPDLPLQQIRAFIEDQKIDLVVMCSRGQISFQHRTRRSMAKQVIQQSPVPVLVLQETFGQEGTLYPRATRPVRIMVPLDGSELAEMALPPAAFLAAALSAPERGMLHLISVFPSLDFLEAGEEIGLLAQRARDNMWTYLQAMGQALRTGILGQLNLSVTTSVLLHPNVADAIVRVAESRSQKGAMAEAGENCDLIALTTHGRSGLHHLSMGNLAGRILQGTHLPFLVIHPTLSARKESEDGSTALTLHQEEGCGNECFYTM